MGEGSIEGPSKGRLGTYEGPDTTEQQMEEISKTVHDDIAEVRGKLPRGIDADEGAGYFVKDQIHQGGRSLKQALEEAGKCRS